MTTTPLDRPTPDADLLRHLTDLEQARSQQLQALPDTDLDPVLSARRASTERILQDVRTALARLAEGRYGVCTGCDRPISAERLELRCWTTACVECAEQVAR